MLVGIVRLNFLPHDTLFNTTVAKLNNIGPYNDWTFDDFLLFSMIPPRPINYQMWMKP